MGLRLVQTVVMVSLMSLLDLRWRPGFRSSREERYRGVSPSTVL